MTICSRRIGLFGCRVEGKRNDASVGQPVLAGNNRAIKPSVPLRMVRKVDTVLGRAVLQPALECLEELGIHQFRLAH